MTQNAQQVQPPPQESQQVQQVTRPQPSPGKRPLSFGTKLVFLGVLGFILILSASGPWEWAYALHPGFACLTFWMGLACITLALLLGWKASFGAALGKLREPGPLEVSTLLTALAAVAAVGAFLMQLVGGQFNDNLEVELAAVGDGKSNTAQVTMALTKGSSGSLRLMQVRAVPRGSPNASVDVVVPFQEFEMESGFFTKTHAQRNENAVLSPGDKMSFAWTMPNMPPGSIIDVALISRRHPFHSLWYNSQWRVSAFVKEKKENSD